MTLKNLARKTLSTLFAAGATLSVGFLSFVGIYALPASLFVAIGGFMLAVAYEGQVYNEGISQALRRIFDRHYTKKAMAQDFLNTKIKELTREENPTLENIFLRAYDEQRKYVAQLEKTHHLSKELQQKKSAAKKALAEMELFFMTELTNESPLQYMNKKQRAVRELMNDQERDKMYHRLDKKKRLIRLSWILAIAGGIASGFATYNAIVVSMATVATTFTAISVIPGGVFVAMAAFAAIGWTFMFYQTLTDIIQIHGEGLKKYFHRRVEDGESFTMYCARMAGIGLVLSLGLFATVATAGTWWFATQRGALLLKLGDVASNVIRSVSVPLMAIAELVYNVTNSVSSVDKIFRSDFTGLMKETWGKITNAWKNETVLEFINPFRVADIFVSKCSRALFFVGHILSMGAIADGLSDVPDDLTMSLNAASEAPVDFNYLPFETDIGEHFHSHDSLLLNIVFFPVTAVSYVCKFLQVGWDLLLGGAAYKPAMAKAFAETKLGHYLFPEGDSAPPAEPQTFSAWKTSDGSIQQKLLTTPVVETAKAKLLVEERKEIEPTTPTTINNITFFNKAPAPVSNDAIIIPQLKKAERRRTMSANR